MPNLIKNIILSDGVYKIDYESLANKPTPQNITLSVDDPKVGHGNNDDLWFVYYPSLNETPWKDISAYSKSGIAKDMYAVGDTKAVELNGTVGTLSVNETLYAYILGFDHNLENGESEGITFGTFKTAETGGVDVCLIDSNYNSYQSDGMKTFNMNHWGYPSSPYNTNYGGWKGCDMRYDIIGSTNIAPSGYGAKAVSGRVGYDPENYDIVNSPVENTLLSAFPQELRSVMKPNTKYTDNVAGGTSHVEANVTASTDYLWLLAEYEIFGSHKYSNNTESAKQTQYQYYIDGGSTVKYQHSATSSTALWWERSPHYGSPYAFCLVAANGSAIDGHSHQSRGLAPAFLV